MPTPRWGAAIVLAAVVGGLVGPGVAPVAARPGQEPTGAPKAAACTESPFSTGFDAALRSRWPGKRISAAVYDQRTGCQYTYRGDLRISTASVLKIEIMANVLLRAQRAGRAITASERSLIGPMIRTSDDPSANALWSAVGGTSGMAALERELGLTETRATSPWGLTSTSAADRNELLRQLVLGQWGPFNTSTRATARSFLLDVTPSQRWGITAGVPSTWKVPMKNGFFPASCCGWRINTSGVVERPDGTAYVSTVLSDGWSSQAAGIPAVEFVSRTIAAWNLTAIGPHLSPGRAARQAYRDVLGRSSTFDEELAVAGRIGATPSKVGGELATLLGRADVDGSSGQILRLHLGAVHALPSPGLWSARLAEVRAGTRTVTDVATEVAASPAFTGGMALATDAFVDRAYQQVVGRSPSASERTWWVGRIDGGTPRGQLLLGLISTNTFRWITARTVQAASANLALLRSLPSPEVLAAQEQRLWSGTSMATLASELFGSPAYAARFSR